MIQKLYPAFNHLQVSLLPRVVQDVRVVTPTATPASFRTLPRRALMHMRLGRRLWWRGRKGNEVEFWAGWLTGAPGTEQWAADRIERLNPETEIRDPVVRAELDRLPTAEVSILDVGAGPLTWLGYRYPGKRLSIVAVDPLADDYDRLLREARLEPPVRTIGVAGEALLEHFAPATFDIAYATNALDHSADPLTIISKMVTVVRPGGVVILRHKRNEGASARYSGLHAWNFDVVDSRLILWNEATSVDVDAALAGCATTTTWLEENEVVARLRVSEPVPRSTPDEEPKPRLP